MECFLKRDCNEPTKRYIKKLGSLELYRTLLAMDVNIYKDYIGNSVFDVGAGMGRMVRYYVNGTDKVVASDIFQHQVDYMNNLFKEHHNFSARLIDIMKDNLSPYQNGFDTVICINVLEHLQDDYVLNP